MKRFISGANGFIGSRFIDHLLAVGVSPSDIIAGVYGSVGIEALLQKGVEVRQLDVLDAESVRHALQGVDVAYYLIHMLQRADFMGVEAQAASNFADAAKSSGVRRIIYMSGLGSDAEKLSDHLHSRHVTGDRLRQSGVVTIEFRASLVMGKGGLSFDLIHNLVTRLPGLAVPKWCQHMTQPIRIEDVVRYLSAASDVAIDGSAIVEIGGPERMPYVTLLKRYADSIGSRLFIVVVPFLPTWVAAKWFNLFTPRQAKVGIHLAESLRHDMVVTDDLASRLFPDIRPMPLFDRPFS